jgi:hypothetical protein
MTCTRANHNQRFAELEATNVFSKRGKSQEDQEEAEEADNAALRGKAFACNRLHLLAKAIELTRDLPIRSVAAPGDQCSPSVGFPSRRIRSLT